MKFLDYAKYYLTKAEYHYAKFMFDFNVDILLNKQNHHSPKKEKGLLEDIAFGMNRISWLAVKLEIIPPEKRDEFRSKLYDEAKKYYS